MQTEAEVIKLDKSFPAVLTKQGTLKRAEFSATLAKRKTSVAIGDFLKVTIEDDLENAIIDDILPRKNKLIRNDPVNRRREQVLAANFDQIAICIVAGEENFNHLARMLTISCNAGVPITLIFTKCDLCAPNIELLHGLDKVVNEVVFVSSKDGDFKNFIVEKEAGLISEATPSQQFSFSSWKDKRTILLGKSGAGKSTLINALAEDYVCKQGNVREFDNKGRHTTVARQIIKTRKYGEIVDMPGLRSLGLINCETGLGRTFSDIYETSKNCKFRNCSHTNEPGCAVRGNIDEQIIDAYIELTKENETNSTTFRR